MKAHFKIFNSQNGTHITDIEMDDELLNQLLDDNLQFKVENGKRYFPQPLDLEAERAFRIMRLRKCIANFEAIKSDDPMGALRLFSHYINNVDELLLTARALFVPFEFIQVNSEADLTTVLNKADFEGLKTVKYSVFEQSGQVQEIMGEVKAEEDTPHVHGPHCNH